MVLIVSCPIISLSALKLEAADRSSNTRRAAGIAWSVYLRKLAIMLIRAMRNIGPKGMCTWGPELGASKQAIVAQWVYLFAYTFSLHT